MWQREAEQMNENPYQNLLNIIRDVSIESNSPVLVIGKVIQDLPNLKIQYNGIILDKHDLWINDYLLTKHTRTHKGHIVSATQYRAGGGGDAEFASHNHDIHNDYTDVETTTDSDLKTGFYVAMFPLQDSTDGTKQKYVVLCHITRGWAL